MSLKITSAYSPGLPLDPTQRKIIFLSAQRGCRAVCQFCGHEHRKYHGNTTTADLEAELRFDLENTPTACHLNRLEVYFTKLGEPTMNDSVLDLVEFRLKGIAKDYAKVDRIYPTVATMFPKMNPFLEDFLVDWCYLKNRAYAGSAGLQFSLYSTTEYQRESTFKGLALPIDKVARIFYYLPRPFGEKYTLNFYANGNTRLRAAAVNHLFDPEKCSVQIVQTKKADHLENYRSYQDFAEKLDFLGWDVTILEPTDLSPLACKNVAIPYL